LPYKRAKHDPNRIDRGKERDESKKNTRKIQIQPASLPVLFLLNRPTLKKNLDVEILNGQVIRAVVHRGRY